MAAIDWTNVTDVAPELSSVSVPFQTLILNHVNGNGVAVDVFDGEAGTDTKLARSLLAAHMGTFFGNDEAFVLAATEGGISRQYAKPEEDLESTGYGRMFARMCRINACGAWMP